ncbi:MAG: beta-lactamase family protein [Clostridia bacterium]|nr:beta-lactamase family protein [Clostridia bacterium]
MKKVTNYLENIIKKLNIPYVDVAVAKGYDTVYRHVINGDKSEKLLMFSMSKPITAVATLLAVQKGIISFSDPVSKYLPFVSNAFLLENGVKVKPKTKITVYSLITMTSGLDYVLETPEVENAFIRNDLTDTVTALKLKLLSPLACEPNTKFLYSLSHDLLGAVIEVASNKRFADFVKDELFIPLDMKNSTFSYVESGLLFTS